MSKVSGDVWRFIGLAIVASVAYGIAHDLVTANIAVTYFTVYHPKIVESQSPWVMAFLWGFLATWWFGLFSGIAVSLANTLGKLPSAPWTYLRGRLIKGLIVCWALAMLVLSGTYGLTVSFLLLSANHLTRQILASSPSPPLTRSATWPAQSSPPCSSLGQSKHG